MIGDAGQDVGEIGLRIDAVQLGRLDDGVENSGPLAAGIGAGEEIILPSEGQRSDRALGGIVAHLQPAVADEPGRASHRVVA